MLRALQCEKGPGGSQRRGLPPKSRPQNANRQLVALAPERLSNGCECSPAYSESIRATRFSKRP